MLRPIQTAMVLCCPGACRSTDDHCFAIHSSLSKEETSWHDATILS